MASNLRVAEARLPKRGLYEIVTEKWEEGTAAKDEQRRKTVKTRRYRVQKRLLKPHESET